MKDLYLRYLLLFVQHNDNNAKLFRRIVDGWNAHNAQGAFLSANGTLRSFNNPSLLRASQLRNEGLSISAEVETALNDRLSVRLVVDHAVPLARLRSNLLALQPQNVDQLQDYLQNFYRLVIITKSEDSLLNERLRADMPQNWDNTDTFARYTAAGIEIIE